LSHNDLQEHFSGRYYVSPSLLYSIIRPLASNSGYDVPIPGDWITIGVIAKRGEIMFTNNVSQRDDDIEDPKDKKGKGKEKEKPEERRKRYMSIKLIDFGTRGHGPKAHIRGDALLSLLLFEADTCSEVSVEGSKRTEQIYKGGSGGAFEACMKLHEGAVIAILNPKIMKPFKVRFSFHFIYHIYLMPITARHECPPSDEKYSCYYADFCPVNSDHRSIPRLGNVHCHEKRREDMWRVV